MTGTTLTRRVALTGSVALAVAAGAAAAPAPATDPIFPAIEKHKAACTAVRAVGDPWSDMSPSDPRYGEFDDAHAAALRYESDALVALLRCQPTTLLGVAAVLEHVGSIQWIFGDDDDEIILQGAQAVDAAIFPIRLAAAIRAIERGMVP